MAIVLELGGIQARYEDGRWLGSEEDAVILDMLNQMMAEPPGLSGDDPYPALTRAREIAQRLYGRIVDAGTAPKSEAGVVY